MNIHTKVEAEGEVGKLITGLSICSSLGQLNAVGAEPASMEDIQDEFFEGAGVKVTFADRVCWMEPREVTAFIDALDLSLRVYLDRYRRANLD